MNTQQQRIQIAMDAYFEELGDYGLFRLTRSHRERVWRKINTLKRMQKRWNHSK